MKFKEYLDKNNLTPRQFAVLARIADATAYSAYKGNPIIKRTAKKIVKATKGSLTLEDLNVCSYYDYINDPGQTRTMDCITNN